MKNNSVKKYRALRELGLQRLIFGLIFAILFPFNLFSQKPTRPHQGRTPIVLTDSAKVERNIELLDTIGYENEAFISVDSLQTAVVDTLASIPPERLKAIRDSIAEIEEFGEERVFNPDPTRAVWMSALFPGLGQLYNRRYWKLPIVVGSFMGLGYATAWNNRMLTDYTKAYRDIMDNDPSTKSYMDFYPPTVKEEDLDKTWLTNKLKSRRDYFRRNRDLCIIGIVGVYLVAMLDAYVDASLSHFDISPDLSMQVAPALIPDSRTTLPSVGVQWALNF